MWTDIKAAVEWGVIWGVKILVVLLVIAAGFRWVVNDMQQIRGRATNGQRVHEFLVDVSPEYRANLQPRVAPLVNEGANGEDESQKDGSQDAASSTAP